MQQNSDGAIAPARASVWWWLALGAVLIGAALRLWQWQLGTTFFIDELAVLHNVATRPLGQLMSMPLAEAQVAPPLFLAAEKACLFLFGRFELAMRLPALLASLAALFLLWSVARRVLDEQLVPLALLTFAVGFTLVYYSNQVKQYAGDVAVSLLVTHLSLELRARPMLRWRFLGPMALTGLLLPFYSQSSLLVFAGCGAALVLLAILDTGQPRLRATLAVVGTWAVGCAGSLVLAQATLQPIDRAFMHFFWRDGLLPLNAHLPVVLAGELAERWAIGLGWPHPSSIWVLLTFTGVVLLWRQRRETALLLLAPWLVSIAASAAQQFPLRIRQMDFLVPTMVLFAFVSFQALVRWAWRRSQLAGFMALACCALPILYSTTRHNLPPYCAEDAKTLYAQLARTRRPGDAVYAYYGAGQYLRWYGAQYGLSPGSYYLGHCFRHLPGAERHYLEEVDGLRGQRVWLLMVHFDELEEQTLTHYLDAIGRRGPRLVVPSKLPDEAVAQYYDLSDAKRAARFSAATFPLPPSPVRPAAIVCWSCYGPQVIANNQY
jgi:hypothetical protein